MSGPPSSSWPPIGIFLLNVYHFVFNLFVFAFALQIETHVLALAFGLTSIIGLWGIILFLMSWFSDPGVITQEDET